jgi:hypothetical protein
MLRSRFAFRFVWFAILELTSHVFLLPSLLAQYNLPKLRVHTNQHILVDEKDRPFFWLGDTAWELIHRLDREQVDRYLDARQSQQFNVIQTVCLAEFDGLHTPNANGHTPLIENDPKRPNVLPGKSDDFWDHVDYVVDSAAKRGMRIALLPTWGEWVTPRFSKPAIFQTPDQGYAYGRFLGDRFRDRSNIIWVLGGDRPGDEAPHGRAVWQAMAEGIADGTNGESTQDGNANWSTTLISYHSMSSSSKWFHQEPWIDFHMWGTYHSSKDWARSFEMATRDYGLASPKPTLNAEPPYEEHPRDYDPKNGWFDEYEIRRAAWWSVTSGSLGHTYGAHPIWQFYDGNPMPKSKVPVPNVATPRVTWTKALELPVANQMRHLRGLFEAIDFASYKPDVSWLTPTTNLDDSNSSRQSSRVTGGYGNDFGLVYVPTGESIVVLLDKAPGDWRAASWYNPRSGVSERIDPFPGKVPQRFDPPGEPGIDQDWVLLLQSK